LMVSKEQGYCLVHKFVRGFILISCKALEFFKGFWRNVSCYHPFARAVRCRAVSRTSTSSEAASTKHRTKESTAICPPRDIHPQPVGVSHRQNIAPKSQPPNSGREISTPRIEENAGKKVSAAKKIARDAEKVPEIRAKSDSVKIALSL
jgi:hypothetical protein